MERQEIINALNSIRALKFNKGNSGLDPTKEEIAQAIESWNSLIKDENALALRASDKEIKGDFGKAYTKLLLLRMMVFTKLSEIEKQEFPKIEIPH